MKKLVRAVRRLLVAGLVGGGAVFAAVKVGPKVTPKLRSVLHRAPPEELPDHDDYAREPTPSGAAESPREQSSRKSAEVPATSEAVGEATPSGSPEPPAEHPATESAQAVADPETSRHKDASQ